MLQGDTLPTLTGPRVKLRWLRPSDVPSLYAVFSDREVMRYWSHPPFERPEQAAELLSSIETCFAERSLFQWGIAGVDDDRVIGTCTLSHLEAAQLRAEVGYTLGRAHWGKGLMGEALVLLLDFAFGELRLRRIEADVDPLNAASVRTLERLGFQREGLLRERWFVGGVPQDSYFYGLLQREWDAVRPALRARLSR
jgi:RimJ/RimL family protein N-acetyltransferase